MTPAPTAQNYIALLEFLLKAKQQVLAVGAEFGLTSMQTLTLVLTDPAKARPMSNLCGMFHCDASNVTGIIDGLEQKQLVSRQNHPNDRRVKVVRLEPAGIETRNQIMSRLTDETGKNGFLFANLNQTETTQFMTLIQKIAQ